MGRAFEEAGCNLQGRDGTPNGDTLLTFKEKGGSNWCGGLLFADDIALMASIGEELQGMREARKVPSKLREKVYRPVGEAAKVPGPIPQSRAPQGSETWFPKLHDRVHSRPPFRTRSTVQCSLLIVVT